MSTGNIIFAAAVILIACISLINYNALLIKRVIKKYRPTPISYTQEGELVRVQGRVAIVGKTLVAPLSKRDCVYYTVRVRDADNSNRSFLNSIDVTETRMTEIVVFDGKDYVLVNKSQVFSHLIKDHVESNNFFQSRSDELNVFLKRKGIDATTMLGYERDLRAEEGILQGGETVELLGIGKWLPASQFSHLKIPAKKVLYLNPADEKGVYLTDEELG